jgi:hypothetical protein
MTAVTATLSQVTGMDAGRARFFLTRLDLRLHLIDRSSDLGPPGMATGECHREERHRSSFQLEGFCGFGHDFGVAAIAPFDRLRCINLG